MGPTYLKPPPEKYVVIANPWGMSPPRQRGQHDFMRLGGWLRYMLRSQGGDLIAEVVYHKRTEDAIIVQLPESTDLRPVLGAHHWSTFWLGPGAATSTAISHIFEYNWRNNGDPGNKDWEFDVPASDHPPSNFPVRYPYPEPVWSERPQIVYFRSLTLPLPVPPPPATPEETTSPAQNCSAAMVSQFLQSAEIAIEERRVFEEQRQSLDEQRAHEEQTANRKASEERRALEEQPAFKCYVDKRDPFEQEEAAELLLRDSWPNGVKKERASSPSVDNEHGDLIRVKREPREESAGHSLSFAFSYRDPSQPLSLPVPSQNVVDAFTRLQARNLMLPADRPAPGPHHGVASNIKTECEAPALQPVSQAVVDAFQRLQERGLINPPDARTSRHGNEFASNAASANVNRDPTIRPGASQRSIRIKQEEQDHPVPARGVIRPPFGRPAHSASQAGATVIAKRGSANINGNGEERVKRMKQIK